LIYDIDWLHLRLWIKKTTCSGQVALGNFFLLFGLHFSQPNPKSAMVNEHDHKHKNIDVDVNAD